MVKIRLSLSMLNTLKLTGYLDIFFCEGSFAQRLIVCFEPSLFIFIHIIFLSVHFIPSCRSFLPTSGIIFLQSVDLLLAFFYNVGLLETSPISIYFVWKHLSIAFSLDSIFVGYRIPVWQLFFQHFKDVPLSSSVSCEYHFYYCFSFEDNVCFSQTAFTIVFSHRFGTLTKKCLVVVWELLSAWSSFISLGK